MLSLSIHNSTPFTLIKGFFYLSVFWPRGLNCSLSLSFNSLSLSSPFPLLPATAQTFLFILQHRVQKRYTRVRNDIHPATQPSRLTAVTVLLGSNLNLFIQLRWPALGAAGGRKSILHRASTHTLAHSLNNIDTSMNTKIPLN